MFSTPGGLGDVAKYAWIFTSYVLLTAIFMPLYNANNPLFTARVFPKREHYSDVAAKTGIVTILAAIVITIVMPIAVGSAGKDPGAWSLVAISAAVVFTLIGLVRFWVFRESPEAAAIETERVRMKDILLVLRTNPHMWILSSMSLVVGIYASFTAGAYYFRYIVGNLALQGVVSISFVALIPLMFFFPVLIRKLSVSRMIAFSSFIGAIGYLVMTVAGGNIAIIMVAAVLTALASLPGQLPRPDPHHRQLHLQRVEGAPTPRERRRSAVLVLGNRRTGDRCRPHRCGARDDGLRRCSRQAVRHRHRRDRRGEQLDPGHLRGGVGCIALYYHRLEKRIKIISAEVLARREISAEVEIIPGAPHSGTEAVRIVREEGKHPFCGAEPPATPTRPEKTAFPRERKANEQSQTALDLVAGFATDDELMRARTSMSTSGATSRRPPIRPRRIRRTETRFSIYFPPASEYEGRFFQHITPVPESEHLGKD